MSDQRLEPASATYGDWVGTAAGDEHGTIGHRNPYEISGLDDSQWWIVAIDVQSEHFNAGDFYVYAVDRNATGISDHDALLAYAGEHGNVPVVSFLVHDIPPTSLIGEAFNQFQLQLRSRAVDGLDLNVVDLRDLNYSGV